MYLEVHILRSGGIKNKQLLEILLSGNLLLGIIRGICDLPPLRNSTIMLNIYLLIFPCTFWGLISLCPSLRNYFRTPMMG